MKLKLLAKRYLRTIGTAAIIGVVLAPAQSCGCAGVGSPAVAVSIVDAQTRAPIAAGATVYVFESATGARLDSVTTMADMGEVLAAWDRTGRIDVVVEKPGYFPWTTTRLDVKGDCTVETRHLTAALRRR